MSASFQQLQNQLSRYGQEHLLRFWNELSTESQQQLATRSPKSTGKTSPS